MKPVKLRLYKYLIVLSALLLIVPYAIYQIAHYHYGVDLDRMYFITSSLATVISFYVLHNVFNDVFIKTVTIWVSSFFVILLLAYIGSGLIWGNSYVYIKIALGIGTLIGLIYYAYDRLTGFKT